MTRKHELHAKLFALARAQAGVVTLADLVGLGFTKAEINYRARTGMLERVLPRTFLVGGSPWDRTARMSAAARWPRGAVSHLCAAVELGFLRMKTPPRIEISTGKPPYKCVDWIEIHHTTLLPREHVIDLSGVPVTDGERTILDLASIVSATRVGMAIDAGVYQGRITLDSLARRTELEARSGRSGVNVVREELAKRAPGYSPGQSGLETRIFEILTDPSVPSFERHYKIDSGKGYPLTFDLGWPDYLAVGEVDHDGTHGSLYQSARDHEKTLAAEALGLAVIRIRPEEAERPDRLRRRVRTILMPRAALAIPTAMRSK